MFLNFYKTLFKTLPTQFLTFLRCGPHQFNFQLLPFSYLKTLPNGPKIVSVTIMLLIMLYIGARLGCFFFFFCKSDWDT